MHETLFSLMSGKNFDEGLYQYKDPPSTECINNPQNDKESVIFILVGLAPFEYELFFIEFSNLRNV